MRSTITLIENMLPDVHEAAENLFLKDKFLAILQGSAGIMFASATNEVFGVVDSAISLARDLSQQQCLGSLGNMLDKIKKWLTFGQNYNPLQDSSDLDFSLMDVDSVPEIMQV